MNIFVLSTDPVEAAQYQCDKHVVKMILESAQLLCSVFHYQGATAPYKLTHRNHPCSTWARESKANFFWLLNHALALCEEYTHRYDKKHKTEEVVKWCLYNYPQLNFDVKRFTPFVIAINEASNCRKVSGFDEMNVVDKYRLYYIMDKPFAKWEKTRSVPSWYNKDNKDNKDNYGI